ncbi:unnamed protein product [Phyllotreta striolata]|uniref:Uncharacterized protein n=1 Tax=Phyllotreta striolata TaxID=444603 RepID=A0A9N9TI38_PHYSR|nr:unnamed protein product [Phyllotreta striolata]
MTQRWYLVLIFISIYITKCLSADNATDNDYPKLQPDWPYCFQFTWFGPDFDNVTRYNGTCADYLDEKRAVGVPCAAPIVITYNGSFPDLDYLWEHHKTSILCKRSENQRCVKYTYFLNNDIANVTYTCAKVQQHKGGFIDNGCYKQKLDEGKEAEICVCKSSNGIHRPCNKAQSFTNFANILYLLAPIAIINNYLRQ